MPKTVTNNTLLGYIEEATTINATLTGVTSFLDVASLDFLKHAQAHGDFTLATSFRNALTEGSSNGMGNLRKAFTDWLVAFAPVKLSARKEGVVFIKDKAATVGFRVAEGAKNLPSTFKKVATPATLEEIIKTLAEYSYTERLAAVIKRNDKVLTKGELAQLATLTTVGKAKAATLVQGEAKAA